MNALTTTPRFPGTTLAEDRASYAADLPAALYAEQQDAEEALQALSDEMSFVAWAPGRTTATWGDMQAMRDEAAAMRAALLEYRQVKLDRANGRRAAR